MKKTKQTHVADFIGLSPQMICDIKKGRRWLSKKSALRISGITGISFSDLVLLSGEPLYRRLVSAMERSIGGKL